MADAHTETEIPEPIPKRSDIAKGIRTVYLNRVAHFGMMLDKVHRQNRRAERIEKFAATGEVKDLDAPEGEEDDMGVNIGNETHHHITIAAPPEPVVTQPLQAPATPVQASKSGIGKFIAAALLGAGSLGAGAAGMAVYNWATNKPAVVAPTTLPPNQFEYRYGLEQRPTPK